MKGKNKMEKVNINLDQCETIICSSCGNDEWAEVMKFKKLSVLLSPNGKEGLIPIPIVRCTYCGKSLEEILNGEEND